MMVILRKDRSKVTNKQQFYLIRRVRALFMCLCVFITSSAEVYDMLW